MEPTAIGNAVIWHRRAKSEEWLWDWEISFRVDCPPHHFPLPRKHSLRRTCFVRGTSTPHIFKGGSWVRAPVSSLPPAFSQTRAVTRLGDAVGSRSGAGCSEPATELRGRCALWVRSQPAHERDSPGHTGPLQGGQQSLRGSPVTEWVTLQGKNQQNIYVILSDASPIPLSRFVFK